MEAFGRIILERSGEPARAFSVCAAVVGLGRAEVNDIVIADPVVSRTHAQIEWTGAGYTVTDLGSANGTWLNGARVTRAPFRPGDALRLGESVLRLELGAADGGDAPPCGAPSHDDASASTPLQQSIARTDLPRLAVHTPARTWELPLHGDALAIGRDLAADIVLPYAQVSRWHAQIERRGGRFTVRDLGSANGVWLGARRVEEHVLEDGDSIRIGPARLTFKGGFGQGDLSPAGLAGGRRGLPRTPVVFVPGFMGSELWRGGERVWPNARYLLSEPEIFRLSGAAPLEARAVAREMVIVPGLVKLDRYNRVAEYLTEALGYERGRGVLEFAYDWRRDVRESAARLAQAIEAWDVRAPITIIAHSMGCLVSRWYVERLGGKQRIGRLILVGGPHLGAPRAVAELLGGTKSLHQRLVGERVRETLAGFPSIYQLLPWGVAGADQDGRPLDLFADDRWLPEPARPLLHEARTFRRTLGTRSSVPAVSIFGYGQKTIARITARRGDDGGWRGVGFETATDGDETVPQRSAVLPGSEIHPVRQSHGALYVDKDVKMRLKLELTREGGGGGGDD
jgi:pSer/pThr/pTyr-binding forkhead associated (FHA) protein